MQLVLLPGALVAVGLLLLSTIGAASTVSDLIPGLAVAGTGLGLASGPITTAALASVPERSAGTGAAVVSDFRLIGLALGVAAMAAIVAVGWPGGAVHTVQDRAAFAEALGTGFLLTAALAAAAALVATLAVRAGRRARLGTLPAGGLA